MTVVPFPFNPVLDPGFIRQLAEKIKSIVKKIVDCVQSGVRRFESALNALVRATFGIAQAFIDGLVAAFNKCCEVAIKIANKISEFVDWLQGPANIEAVGKAIGETYPTALTELSDSVKRENLKSNAEWSGDGAEAFFGSASRQQGAIEGVQGVVTSLGTTLVSVGAGGKAILTGFIIAVGAAAITMIVAIGVTCAFPPSAGVTVPICVAVFAFILALAVAVGVAANNIAQQISNAQTSLDGQLPGGGSWPQGVGGGGVTQSDAETDATVKDGDADWSTDG